MTRSPLAQIEGGFYHFTAELAKFVGLDQSSTGRRCHVANINSRNDMLFAATKDLIDEKYRARTAISLA